MPRPGRFPVALRRIGRGEERPAFGDRRLLILGSGHDEDRLVETGYSANRDELEGHLGGRCSAAISGSRAIRASYGELKAPTFFPITGE